MIKSHFAGRDLQSLGLLSLVISKALTVLFFLSLPGLLLFCVRGSGLSSQPPSL